MKKNTLLIILTLSSFTICAQEKIAEFITTHVNVGTGAVKSEIQFQLFENKLVLNYMDKKTIKTMSKSGLDPFIVFPYSLTKNSNGQAIWYKYQDEELQIMVMLEGNPKPSVTIKSRDSFTGVAGPTQTYFSLLNK
jgi:hypothetical protein